MKLHAPGQQISIGGPTPNNNVYVLDENMKAVPIGQPGVMWAGGGGITRGYVDLPEKTAERYKLDPFTNDGSVVSTWVVAYHTDSLTISTGPSCSTPATLAGGFPMELWNILDEWTIK